MGWVHVHIWITKISINLKKVICSRHFYISITKAVRNPCFTEVFSGISKAAGWQWDLGEPVEGGFVTMWGWFRHLKMICRTSISKYAVAQPSKHLQESVTVTQACIQHTYTHTTESLADVPTPHSSELGHAGCFVRQCIFGPSDLCFPPSGR